MGHSKRKHMKKKPQLERVNRNGLVRGKKRKRENLSLRHDPAGFTEEKAAWNERVINQGGMSIRKKIFLKGGIREGEESTVYIKTQGKRTGNYYLWREEGDKKGQPH